MIVGLYGELGAGKTAFVKAMAEKLGVRDYVISPTFIIMKNYRLKAEDHRLLVHIDAHRLDSGKELLKLGWKDLIKDSQNLIFVEWADRVENILPKNSIKIHFRHINKKTREIDIIER